MLVNPAVFRYHIDWRAYLPILFDCDYGMFNVVLFALLAASANGLQTVANKHFVAQSGLQPVAASMWIQLTAALCAFLIMLVTGTLGTWPELTLILTCAVLVFIGYGFTSIALASDDASAVGPILGLKVLFVAFLEYGLGFRTLSTGIMIGTVLSLFSVILIGQTDTWSLHWKDLIRPGVLMMAMAAFCFAVCDVVITHLALPIWKDASVFAFHLCVLSGGGAILVLALRHTRLIRGLQWEPAHLRQKSWALVLAGIAIVLAQVFIFLSFKLGDDATLTNIVNNLRNLLVVGIMAVIVLGRGSTIERVGWRAYAYRISGAVLSVGAIALALGWK